MKPKILFLLGAGASNGAGGFKNNRRPPLGPGLFDELVKEYPDTWKKLGSNLELSKILKESRHFETAMAFVRDQIPENTLLFNGYRHLFQ